MQLSAEARLWWPDGQCDGVGGWFEALSALAPGGAPAFDASARAHARTDVYVLDPGQAELGIKMRASGTSGARVEVKSLVAARGEAAPFGPVTLWTKSASAALTLDGIRTVSTTKLRRLRKFAWTGTGLKETALDEKEKVRHGAAPDAGCNLEFTRVAVETTEAVWWTLGYEAFGGLDDVERILRTCLAQTLACRPLPAAGAATPASYPEWLILASRRGHVV